MSIYYRTADYVIKAALDKGDGIMVALSVAPEAARVLAVEDGQPASDLHITLVYLGKKDAFSSDQMQMLHDIVGAIARTSEPITVNITGYGVFPDTDDGPVLYAAVEKTPELDALQETIVEAVSSYGLPPQGKGQGNGKWVPHITLAYGQSAPPPEKPPIDKFMAEWLTVNLGNTEAMMRLTEPVKKDGDGAPAGMASDSTNAFTSSDLNNGGRIAPQQGMFKKPRKRVSSMMKAALWDESKHPRNEGGEFSEGGGGGGKIYMSPENVAWVRGWGDQGTWQYRDPKTGTPTGEIVSGTETKGPFTAEDLPDNLYHTTVHMDKLKGSTHLLAQHDGGGMGGGNYRAGVSLTTSASDAKLMQTELRRAIGVSKADPKTIREQLAAIANEDEKNNGLAPGTLKLAADEGAQHFFNQPAKYQSRNTALEAFQSYLRRREAIGGAGQAYRDFNRGENQLKNPLILGTADDFSKLDPANVGIVKIPKASMPDPSKAFTHAGTDDFLHEIRVHADVPLKGSEVVKDEFGGGQGQGQGLAVATAPEYNKRPVKPEFPAKFEGAIGPAFEEKDPNGDYMAEIDKSAEVTARILAAAWPLYKPMPKRKIRKTVLRDEKGRIDQVIEEEI